jgi:integrase
MSSIETRRSPANGTVSYRVRFRHQGKNMPVTFLTLEQAQTWRAVLDTVGPDLALRLLKEPERPQSQTVADLIDHHIDHLTGADEGTRHRYRTLADQHLRERFSLVDAIGLTADDVRRWVNDARLKNGKPPAPKTIRNWHALLSAALDSAAVRGAIPGNVARGVKLPRVDAEGGEEKVFLTREEFSVIYGETPEQWRPLVLLLALTGMRWGEATALTVGALDQRTHSARIHTAWKQSGKTGAPKSPKSRRTAAVPAEVFDAIEPLLEGKGPSELIFLSPRGKRVRSGNFYNSVWKGIVERAEPAIGKRPRVHDLRHSFASWAIQANIPLPVIQRQLGHEKIETTVGTYGHLARSDFDPLLYLGVGITKRLGASEEGRALPAPAPRA